MAFQFQAIIEAQYAPNAQTTLYTSPVSTYTRIDSLSVTNTGATAQTISVNLVTSGGSAATSNLTTKAQSVQAGATWNSPNEIGKVLNPGDFISVIASAASQLVIAAGGVIGT